MTEITSFLDDEDRSRHGCVNRLASNMIRSITRSIIRSMNLQNATTPLELPSFSTKPCHLFTDEKRKFTLALLQARYAEAQGLTDEVLRYSDALEYARYLEIFASFSEFEKELFGGESEGGAAGGAGGPAIPARPVPSLSHFRTNGFDHFITFVHAWRQIQSLSEEEREDFLGAFAPGERGLGNERKQLALRIIDKIPKDMAFLNCIDSARTFPVHLRLLRENAIDNPDDLIPVLNRKLSLMCESRGIDKSDELAETIKQVGPIMRPSFMSEEYLAPLPPELKDELLKLEAGEATILLVGFTEFVSGEGE